MDKVMGEHLNRELLDRLQGVQRVAAITGAGISRECGIPTYRGPGGLYDDPEVGDATVAALSAETLQRDPDRTWSVLGDLARLAAGTEPGLGHRALVAIENSVESFVLLTQNVDGLHEAAGSRNVIDIHGHVFDTLCTGCGREGVLDRCRLENIRRALRCEDCGERLRPQVVLFGEMLSMEKVERIHEEFYRQIADLTIITGTSAIFPYVTEPVIVAHREGRLTIEIDPAETSLSDFVDFSLRGEAGHFLPLIAEALRR